MCGESKEEQSRLPTLSGNAQNIRIPSVEGGHHAPEIVERYGWFSGLLPAGLGNVC